MTNTSGLTGRKFGRLTVLRKDIDKPGCWDFRCDCGAVKSARDANKVDSAALEGADLATSTATPAAATHAAAGKAAVAPDTTGAK